MDYLKVLLYVYPRIDYVNRDIEDLITSKAVASFNYNGKTERQIQQVIQLVTIKNNFLILKDDMGKIIEVLSMEEKYLLEYKYFRRNRVLKGEFKNFKLDYCERTYFRKQTKLLTKLFQIFNREGLTYDWFIKTFSKVAFMMNYLRKVQDCERKTFCEKRKKNILACDEKLKRIERAEKLIVSPRLKSAKIVKRNIHSIIS